MSVGLDHIDLETCASRGISVGYTPDLLSDTTAELAMTLTLNACRRIGEAQRAVYSGVWNGGPVRCILYYLQTILVFQDKQPNIFSLLLLFEILFCLMSC